jgi:dienelactone hydrolase
LALPAGAHGVVLFAHGSGSSRNSHRNRKVARSLHERRLATLLLDLLTEDEEALDLRRGRLRFDMGLLSRRMIDASDWLAGAPQTRDLRVGCFGASTGAGAALVAAAERPAATRVVVSRGGRPDLAGLALPHVKAPALFIVGGDDGAVIDLNREAMAEMRSEVRLHIVPGATHLFEEPGALEEVARLAGDWFEKFLIGGRE